jgi:hypothetical protein
MSASSHKSKTLEAWTALVGGSLGLHRFYLHGFRDVLGWLHPLPTLIGAYGILRARQFGQDDHWAWALIPVLGLMVAGSMLCAIVYGLMDDAKWDQRFNRGGARKSRTGWGAIIAVILALMVGAGVLMATIAFSGQRFFEYQVEPSGKQNT